MVNIGSGYDNKHATPVAVLATWQEIAPKACGGFGHMARDCTQGQKCYTCGGFGHMARDCTQGQKR